MRTLSIVGAGLVAALSLFALVWLFQRRLIYLPDTRHVQTAAAVLADAEDVEFDTADGLTLRGWFVPPREGAGRATILVFNGNAGNRAHRTSLADALSRQGFAVLLFDYRGYGGNPGRPTESGLLADARAARAHLDSRGDVDPNRVVYFGESLGTGVAVALAVEMPPAALVLRSPFTSLTQVAKKHYPFLPVGLLLSDRFPSVERITGLDCPLLVIAGDRDRIVPTALSRELYEAAPHEGKRLLIVKGVGHNDFELLAGATMITEIARFLADEVEAAAPPQPGPTSEPLGRKP